MKKLFLLLTFLVTLFAQGQSLAILEQLRQQQIVPASGTYPVLEDITYTSIRSAAPDIYYPATVNANDILILSVGIDGIDDFVTTGTEPTGWTLIGLSLIHI